MHLLNVHAGGDGELGIDESLVKAACLGFAKNGGEHFEWCDIRMQSSGNVIDSNHLLGSSDAAQDHFTLALLSGLHGVGLGDDAIGPGNLAQGVCDEGECLGLVELAGDYDVGIVGLVVLLVENCEVGDGNTLNVAAVADDAFAVVVEVESGGEDALFEHVFGRVLAHFHLVADDGHFGDKILAEHGHVDHAVGLEPERPAQVVVAGVHDLEVHGLVVAGLAVEVAAA